MDKEYHIEYLDQPAWEVIGNGLRDYNTHKAGAEQGKSLCFVVVAPDQTIVGGVIGETHWEWLFINLMWIEEGLRGRGYGHQLLEAIEAEARKLGAKNAYLDSFSFQVPGFYIDHGYQVYGVLDDFPPGHQRYYLKKQL